MNANLARLPVRQQQHCKSQGKGRPPGIPAQQMYPLSLSGIFLREEKNEQQIPCHALFRHEIKSALMHLGTKK